MNPEDEPNALKDPAAQKRRKAMLDEPHIKPLKQYADSIRAAHSNKRVPEFDPCDGGIHARALFLLEAPGPKAVRTGFISRNNPDPTANNLCRLLQEANIPRADTVIWNIVPWYLGNDDGTRILPVTPADLREALPHLEHLLTLLTALKVIVLVGRKAQAAQRSTSFNVPVIHTPHPSAQVFNRWPHMRDKFREGLLQVASIINHG